MIDYGHERAVQKNRVRRRGIYILPNLFTLAALFFGFYAIVQAMNLNFDQAAIGIFVAMVLDSLDGRVARLTKTQSAFAAPNDTMSARLSNSAPNAGSRASPVPPRRRSSADSCGSWTTTTSIRRPCGGGRCS